MELLPDSVRTQLPALYSAESVRDPLVVCKFFLPGTNWTWYAIEFDGRDIFFGYVVGQETELGYFSLREMQEARGPQGFRVERDLYFQPQPLSQIMSLHE